MKRVIFGALAHEAASFVPGCVDLQTIRQRGLWESQDIFSPTRGKGQQVDGIIQIAEEENVSLIPTIIAYGFAGPPVSDQAYAFVKEKILAGIREHRKSLDGVVLPLHGAMTTESLQDPEGDLIEAVRDEVGPEVPIVVGLDMHCHLTDRMIHQADVIVGYHTHPHVDFVDTGIRAMRLLVRTMRGEVKPVMVQRKLQMITSAEKHNTNQGPMSEVMGRILEIEKTPGVLAATIFATQPWMDVSRLGWSIVVVTDGEEALARKWADEIALMAWERRERFLVKKTPIHEALAYVKENDGKPFVLADSSDSVTGGAYGDGNILLRELLAMDFQDTALMTLTDPEAVAACFNAGVSGQVSLDVGGRLTPQFYSPVTVTGYVKTLTDGKYMGDLPSRPANIGRTAVLQVNGINLLLSESKAGTIDAAAYHTAGLDPKDFKIVQVKSPGGFRAIYEPFAAGVFEIDTPGPTDSELTRLPFKNITRPLWPFDPELNKPWNGEQIK